MARQEEPAAVLIADVVGSTPLYESSGSIKALALIEECLQSLSSIVEAEGGDVVRSQGDDILCTFSDPGVAVRTASLMVEDQAPRLLEIHVGIDYGNVVKDPTGVYGDTVNVAARMLALAKPGEIITTEAVVSKLSGAERQLVRLLDSQTVKGKSAPMNIYSVFKEDHDLTYHVGEDGYRTVRLRSVEIPERPKAMITLMFGGDTIERRERDPVFRIGRSQKSDFVIDEPCVSREHALITVRRGRVTATDLSSTGTWIAQADGEPVLLRRDVMHLTSDGLLSLGLRPRDDGPTIIHYRLGTESDDDD
jgi:adenylate cyclase